MNWTPDRPTKPGKYWLSVHPEIRTSNGMRIPHTLLVEVDSGGSVEAEGCSDWSHLLDPMLEGAQWRPCVEPPDPFAEGERLITVTLTVEERQTLSSALNLVAQSVREMPWDRPEDEDRARELASKMEALNTRLCEVPQ